MYVVAANRCSVHNLKQSNLASPIVNGVHNEDFNTYPNVHAAIASLKEDRCLSPGSCSCYDEGCRGCCLTEESAQVRWVQCTAGTSHCRWLLWVARGAQGIVNERSVTDAARTPTAACRRWSVGDEECTCIRSQHVVTAS
ncbi:Hypothetical protein SMAX5B_005537 [Scophthalmus maximus]|uniref:Uncharacterized protein n=1 Tax=Scophthalmus maximus TaxID=52904 RepID=A0A2U9AW94_SCOMX|nr:Hypothetical protein SMAX5B_005537 [Scophthalmus maximus]